MDDPGLIFVDTNVFLRFLTNDLPEQADRAARLFRQATEGRARLATSVMVIAEIVWVLESYYGLAKAEIASMVESILSTPNLQCDEAEIVLRAADFYATKNVDFIDAYHAHLLPHRRIGRIATFDRKHCDRVTWLELLEP
ncbi:MAG: type II toxin-antitoxin system VapC family toxin [Holophagales bacterium]|nr:type II toxin-antitoxin system VapC family toxin [Holophagales bacterium]